MATKPKAQLDRRYPEIVTDEGGVAVELQYVDRIIIRTYQYGRNGLPASARYIPRKSEGARDRKHDRDVDKLGEDAGRKKRDRIRPGHKDTGEPVINGETGVLLRCLPNQIIDDGYVLVDFHVAMEPEKNPKKGREPRERCIPTWTFVADGKEMGNVRMYLAALRSKLDANHTLFMYDNIDGSVTLNLSSPEQSKDRSFLVIEKRAFVRYPVKAVDEFIEEAREAIASGLGE